MNRTDILEDKLQCLRKTLRNHDLYGNIRTIEDVQIFMENHVSRVFGTFRSLETTSYRICLTRIRLFNILGNSGLMHGIAIDPSGKTPPAPSEIGARWLNNINNWQARRFTNDRWSFSLIGVYSDLLDRYTVNKRAHP